MAAAPVEGALEEAETSGNAVRERGTSFGLMRPGFFGSNAIGLSASPIAASTQLRSFPKLGSSVNNQPPPSWRQTQPSAFGAVAHTSSPLNFIPVRFASIAGSARTGILGFFSTLYWNQLGTCGSRVGFLTGARGVGAPPVLLLRFFTGCNDEAYP